MRCVLASMLGDCIISIHLPNMPRWTSQLCTRRRATRLVLLAVGPLPLRVGGPRLETKACPCMYPMRCLPKIQGPVANRSPSGCKRGARGDEVHDSILSGPK